MTTNAPAEMTSAKLPPDASDYNQLRKDILEPSNFINPTFEPHESSRSGKTSKASYLFPSSDEKDKLHPYSLVVEPGYNIDSWEARRRSMEVYKHEMNFRRNMTLILIVVLIIFVFVFMVLNAPRYNFFS